MSDPDLVDSSSSNGDADVKKVSSSFSSIPLLLLGHCIHIFIVLKCKTLDVYYEDAMVCLMHFDLTRIDSSVLIQKAEKSNSRPVAKESLSLEDSKYVVCLFLCVYWFLTCICFMDLTSAISVPSYGRLHFL